MPQRVSTWCKEMLKFLLKMALEQTGRIIRPSGGARYSTRVFMNKTVLRT